MRRKTKIAQTLRLSRKHLRYRIDIIIHFCVRILTFWSSQYLVVVGSSLRKTPYYYQVYVMYLSLLINALLPLLALSFLNTQVLLSLRRHHQEAESLQTTSRGRELRLARVSCVIVIGELGGGWRPASLPIIVPVFVSCHSVRWVPNVYELQQQGSVGTVGRY